MSLPADVETIHLLGILFQEFIIQLLRPLPNNLGTIPGMEFRRHGVGAAAKG
jgi:hypothetical protein